MVPWSHCWILGLGWYIPFLHGLSPLVAKQSKHWAKNFGLFTNCSWIFKCACWPLIVVTFLDLLLDNALGHGCWGGSKWTELLVQPDQKQTGRAVPSLIHKSGPKENNASVAGLLFARIGSPLSVLWRHLLQSTSSWSWKPIWEKANM